MSQNLKQVKLSKETVATHEAGHVLAILRFPIRNHIVETRLFLQDDEWRGTTTIEGNRTDVDPTGIYEFAKGLAGPITQLHFYPHSPSPELGKLLKETGGLVNAMRHVLENDLKIESNWWHDLETWRVYCLRCLQQKREINGTSYLAVEKALARDIENDAVKATIQELAARLLRDESVDRRELLAIKIDRLPELRLPQSLPHWPDF